MLKLALKSFALSPTFQECTCPTRQIEQIGLNAFWPLLKLATKI
jgi:hypothetical protein